MRSLGDHPVTQFLIMGFAFLGFLILVKSGAAYLPDSAPFSAVKKVVLMA
jgi:hypothetical protein